MPSVKKAAPKKSASNKTKKTVKEKKLNEEIDSNKKFFKAMSEEIAQEKKGNEKVVDKEFAKELEAEKKTVKAPNHSVKMYRRNAFIFIFLTLALLAVIFYFTFAKLTIVVVPAQEEIKNDVLVDVYNDGAQVSDNQGTKEKGIVTIIDVNAEKDYEVTGGQVIGEEVNGKVKLINNYNSNQPLVKSTRLLSSDGKLFRLKQSVTVPAGGSIEAEIYADKVSADMAIAPTKFTIPGLWAGLQDKIYAENSVAFTYDKKLDKQISQEDIDNAIKDMNEVLLNKVNEEIGTSYNGYDEVVNKIDDSATKITTAAKVGDKKDKFTVKATSKVSIIAFSKEEMVKLAKEKISALIPDDKKLESFDESSVVYNLESYNLNDGSATIKLSFSGKMSLKDGSNLLDPKKISNFNLSQLEDYLKSFKEISYFEFKFYPSFIEKVPSLSDRIEVKIQK